MFVFPVCRKTESETILFVFLFKLVYDSIMWALKHTMRTISELGLDILQIMLRKFQTCDPQAAQTFYQVYYLETMQHIFAVVAECSHTSGMMNLFLN
jgi:exportin-1